MKKLSTMILYTCLILFLSACSRGYRSNAHFDHATQQQQATIQHQKHQARINVQRSQQVAYTRRPQASHRPRLVPKQKYSSQQTNTNVLTSQQQARHRISQIAHSTIGAPYKWGGNNPREGFDCSGLMSYVHRNAIGINIPRTAAQQRDKSRTVPYSQLQPGDMLFFKTGRNSNHVGVYIGNRKFVHAATGSKHVKITSMDSSYWHKRFVKFGTFL